MSLTIELTPALETRLRREADRLGLPLAEYALQLLDQQLRAAVEGDERVDQTAHEDWLRRFTDWTGSHSDLPKLAPDAFERESFHEDRLEVAL